LAQAAVSRVAHVKPMTHDDAAAVGLGLELASGFLEFEDLCQLWLCSHAEKVVAKLRATVSLCQHFQVPVRELSLADMRRLHRWRLQLPPSGLVEQGIKAVFSQSMSVHRKLDATLASNLASRALRESCGSAGIVDVLKEALSWDGCLHEFSVEPRIRSDSIKHVFESAINLRPLDQDALRVTLRMEYETRFSRCGAARVQERPDISLDVSCSLQKQDASHILFDFSAAFELSLLSPLEKALSATRRKRLRRFLADYDLDDLEAGDAHFVLFWEVFDRRLARRPLSRSNSTLGSLSAVNPDVLFMLTSHLGLGRADAAAALRATALALLGAGLWPPAPSISDASSDNAEPGWRLWQMQGDMDENGTHPMAHFLTFLENEADFLVEGSSDS